MKTRRKYLVGLLAATLVLTGMPVQHTQAAKAAKLSSKKVTLKVGKSKTITLKNNKKKTTWKVISGKKCIKLKNKKKNKGGGMLCIQQPAHVGYNNSTITEKLQALF